MSKEFERIVIIKNYGNNGDNVETLLNTNSVAYEKEYVCCFEVDGKVIDCLYFMYRFDATNDMYTNIYKTLKEMEGSDDWLVLSADSVAGGILRVQRK